MRSRTFRRVLVWDPHPLTRRRQRFWSNLQRVRTRPWRGSTSHPTLTEAAQSLRKVSALVRAGLSAHDAWLQVGEGEEGVPYGVASIVLKQAGEHARMVTAACAVSYELGAPLSAVLDALAQNFDDIERIQKARRVAGAGPALSAKILNLLPLLALLAVFTMGINPFPVLVDGGVGSMCAVIGLSFLGAGRWVSLRLIRRSSCKWEEVAQEDLAIICELVIAALESGVSIPRALECIGRSAQIEELVRVASCLTLGVRWDRAWEGCGEGITSIAEVLREAWVRGASVDHQLHALAEASRDQRLTDARARAEELGVKLVVPLGLLMLPAFIFLGVAPVLLTMARNSF